MLGFLDAAEKVVPDDRFAIFDNDGTLSCEKPTTGRARLVAAQWGR